MLVTLIVCSIVAVAVFLLLQRLMSAATAKAAYNVLDVLYDTINPLNVSEILDLVPNGSTTVIKGILYLHGKNMISSNLPVTQANAAFDTGYYSITREGRQEVRQRRGLIT